MNLLCKPVDRFLNDKKFLRKVIFEQTVVAVWPILIIKQSSQILKRYSSSFQ